MPVLLVALILGIVEGLTEFLPVSSTGHLILAGDLLGFDNPMFEVVIQLGAILAICVLFSGRITHVLADLPHSARARRAVAAVLIGFLPAAVIGFLLHKAITRYLFSPWVVCASLFVGGIAILIIERIAKRSDVVGVAEIPAGIAVGIGIAQCLAMVPGVSRSGATIMGALSLGVERRTAAEFSFFLAVPTMVGATTLEFVKHRHDIVAGAHGVGFGAVGVGFVVSFIVALIVVRAFVHYISKHGFAPFAWYRIIVGAAALAWLTLR